MRLFIRGGPDMVHFSVRDIVLKFHQDEDSCYLRCPAHDPRLIIERIQCNLQERPDRVLACVHAPAHSDGLPRWLYGHHDYHQVVHQLLRL